MDDAMLDLMADHGELRRRLGAYAESRLSPDLAASTRMRARVLAVAHRQSALRGADATLALIADPTEAASATTRSAIRIPRPRPAWRRTAAVLLAATLAVATMTGAALAARPAGALYGARVWVETLTLPTDPRERAIAELARLTQRLEEVAQASAQGDAAAAGAALVAYQAIADEAASAALSSGDDIAILAMEAGMANNIAVLGGLVDRLPSTASSAVEQALERAIARSQDTIDGIDAGQGDGHGAGGQDGDPGNGGHGAGDPGNGNGVGPAPQPTADAPTATPTPTPKATKPPKPEPTPKAEPTAKPKPTAKAEPTARPGPPGGGNQRSPAPGATPRPTPRGGGD